MPTPTKRKRWSAKRWGLVCLFTVLAIWGLWPSSKWTFERKLPSSAKEVRVWSWEDGLLPDYTYLLKARVSSQEFDRYVADIGLTPHKPDRQYEESSDWLSWSGRPGGGDGSWWNPSTSLETTLVSQGHNSWTYAKYENGYLYLKSLNH